MTELLWGFCERCELWRLERWGAPAVCPFCGGEPHPIERMEDGVARVALTLELPPGSELPLLS
jgi:hypothetical protein